MPPFRPSAEQISKVNEKMLEDQLKEKLQLTVVPQHKEVVQQTAIIEDFLRSTVTPSQLDDYEIKEAMSSDQLRKVFWVDSNEDIEDAEVKVQYGLVFSKSEHLRVMYLVVRAASKYDLTRIDESKDPMVPKFVEDVVVAEIGSSVNFEIDGTTLSLGKYTPGVCAYQPDLRSAKVAFDTAGDDFESVKDTIEFIRASVGAPLL